MAALPFALKTLDGLIAQSPENATLHLAAARGFAAYAYLVRELEEGSGNDTASRRRFDARTARLFQRARDHAIGGLEIRHPGMSAALAEGRVDLLPTIVPADAELVYWAGAAWAGAIGADKRDLAMVATLPTVTALVERMLTLDESFDGGAAHALLMQLRAAGPVASMEAAEHHYRRAVELSGGTSAGVHVSYAETVAVARQDRQAFRAALDSALAVDPDAAPARRLVNMLARRRARRLLGMADELFVTREGETS